MANGRYDPARKLALMHVPKSFGTSLTEGLAAAIEPRLAVTGFDMSMFGAFDAFDTFDAATRAAVFTTPESLPDVDLVAGHISCSTLRARYGDAQMMTVLREPISRLLSHWLFWRGHSDAQLAGWGAWADMVRLTRGSLASFLGDARVACQNDNQVVRMLLWPHPFIPADGFIDPAHDSELIAKAGVTLGTFAFFDVAEADGFTERLQHWIGRPFALRHRHETQPIPADLRCPLHRQLTPAALACLTDCSRLDRQLWLSVARNRLPDQDVERLAEHVRLVNVARFAGLMADGQAS